MISLKILELDLSVCRFAQDSPIPNWALDSAFVSITRTADELSVVCDSNMVPAKTDVLVESGWSALRVAGTLDFSLVGVLSSITSPLAKAGISVFAISTYDTDYLLFKHDDKEKLIETLAPEFSFLKE